MTESVDVVHMGCSGVGGVGGGAYLSANRFATGVGIGTRFVLARTQVSRLTLSRGFGRTTDCYNKLTTSSYKILASRFGIHNYIAVHHL